MTSKPKVVVSATLGRAGWGPTAVIRGDVRTQIVRLKEQPGQGISVGASGTLVRFLLREGLLDELQLLIHPVVLGAGKRLFEGGGPPSSLQLVDCSTFTTGVVALRYAPAV
jgi:dihydrofolate reductase